MVGVRVPDSLGRTLSSGAGPESNAIAHGSGGSVQPLRLPSISYDAAMPPATHSRSKPVIAISAGDPGGIGPEVVWKSLADPSLARRARFVVMGMPAVSTGGRPASIPHRPSAAGGRESFQAVLEAIAACKAPPGHSDHADAMVTAPISKESWGLAGVSFPGHTELLAHEFRSPRSGMFFVGPRLRVMLVTVHVPLARVPRLVTARRVGDAIDLASQACRDVDGPRTRPRIAVAGLNPHAGEGGLFGPEDLRVIAPAVRAAQRRGINVTGPLPGDSVFALAAQGKFEAVVAMYHDQGLIPMKVLNWERTVNVTVGLSWKGRRIIRTSPAHGTAFDIAGKGLADPTSMVEAVRLAIDLVHRR